MRRLAASTFILIAVAAPLGAQPPPPTETEGLLLECRSAEDLRSRLLDHAHRAEATDHDAAAESHYYVGVSYERAGMRDSAVASYRRALALRGGLEERLALADALMARRGSGDVAAAIELLEHVEANLGTERLQAAYESRLAWAQCLAEHPDSALTLFGPLEAQLSKHPEWRYRTAVARLKAGDLRKAFNLLLPLAVASRKQDDEVMGKLREIADRAGVANRLDTELDRAIAERDRVEAVALERMTARRLRFLSSDRFPLSGLLLEPRGKARHHPAVVLVAPGDSIADYDSLGVALNHAGFAVMLVEVRGSGWSVAPSCPLPDTWAGREEELERLVARDVRAALGALARAAPVDTSRYLVAGVGPTTSMAVEAADLDGRVFALLLVSPKPAAVERGPMRTRLARLQIPVYFQSGPEDFENSAVTEALYQAGNRGASRVAEARLVGHGPKQFYYDPALTARFIRWLEETTRLTARRGPPPSARPRE